MSRYLFSTYQINIVLRGVCLLAMSKFMLRKSLCRPKHRMLLFLSMFGGYLAGQLETFHVSVLFEICLFRVTFSTILVLLLVLARTISAFRCLKERYQRSDWSSSCLTISSSVALATILLSNSLRKAFVQSAGFTTFEFSWEFQNFHFFFFLILL